MSIQAVACAIALRGVSSTEKLLMIALANYADADMRCYPSHKTLAEDTCLSERTILSALKSLGERGLLKRAERRRLDGSRSTDLITLYFAGEIVSPPPETVSPHGKIDSQTKPQLTVIGGETVSPLTTFEPSTNHQIEEPSERRARRACRLSGDWSPTQTDWAYGLSQGLNEQELSREADNFLDYWRAIPGQRGLKLDWPATWRKWIRTAAERRSAKPSVRDEKLQRMFAGAVAAIGESRDG